MIVGIDASRANKKFKTGTEWYAYNLIRELANIDSENQYFLYLSEPWHDDINLFPKNFYFKLLSWFPKYFWTLGRLSWEMLVRPPEILLVPAHSLPLYFPKKTVVTIHDLGFLSRRGLYHPLAGIYHRLSARWSIYRAAKIITISTVTSHDILRRYKINPDKVEVIPLGYDKNLFHPVTNQKRVKEVMDKYNLTSPYFIYLGRLEKKKNTPWLLEYWKTFYQNHRESELVLVGDLGYGKKKIQKLMQQPGVRYFGYVDKQDLPVLLNKARALVFPSLFEGFGLPFLEAMACDCPVIGTALPVFKEVAGEAAVYFEIGDNSGLFSLMESALLSSSWRQEMISRGRRQVDKYDWAKTATKTLTVLKSL